VVYRCVAALLRGPRGRITAVAFAAWVSTVLAATGCAAQLAWSGKVEWKSAFAAMVGIHLLIGLGEGLISALVFAAIQRTRPELLSSGAVTETHPRWGELAFFGLLAALGLALFIAPLACPWPDGLEAVAGKLGFAPAATPPRLSALAPDYVLPGIHSAALATALAGAVGCLIVFVLALVLARILVPNRTRLACAAPAKP
jgi:cobalt/nickel transport system permease protein